MAHFEAVTTFMRGAPHPHPRTDPKHRITHIAINEVNIYWRPEPTSTVSTSHRRDLSRPQQAFNQGQHRMANEPENRLPENSQRVTEASGRKTFLQRFEALSNQARLSIHHRVATHPHITFMEFDYYVHDEVEFILEEEGMITAEPKDNSLREGFITTNHPNRRDYHVSRRFVRNVDGTQAIQGRFFVTDNLSTVAQAAAMVATKQPGPKLQFRRSVRLATFEQRKRNLHKVDSSVPASVIKTSIEAGRPRQEAATYLSMNWVDGPFIRLLRKAKRRIRFLRKGQILPSYYFESDMIRNINRHHWPLAKAANNPLRLRVRSTALGRAFAVAAIAAVAA